MRARGGEPEYPGQPELPDSGVDPKPTPSTLNLQPSTLRGRITKFSAHPIGTQALSRPTILGAAIAPNRCWGSKSVSRAQIGSARRGAWGFCCSFQGTHAPQPHRPPRLKADLRRYRAFSLVFSSHALYAAFVFRLVVGGWRLNSSGSERDRCGCSPGDVECQLAPGLWTLDSKL